MAIFAENMKDGIIFLALVHPLCVSDAACTMDK
jgi:hypothetical protein